MSITDLLRFTIQKPIIGSLIIAGLLLVTPIYLIWRLLGFGEGWLSD